MTQFPKTIGRNRCLKLKQLFGRNYVIRCIYGRLEHLEIYRHYTQILAFSRGGSAKKYTERPDLAQPHVPGLDDRTIKVCGIENVLYRMLQFGFRQD